MGDPIKGPFKPPVYRGIMVPRGFREALHCAEGRECLGQPMRKVTVSVTVRRYVEFAQMCFCFLTRMFLLRECILLVSADKKECCEVL